MSRQMSQKAKVRGPRQNLRKQNGPAGSSSATGPQQLASNIRFKHRYRFTASSAVNTGITANMLLGVCGGVGDVVNSVISAFTESTKIRKIEIWSAPSAQGQNATCSINWAGLGNSPNMEVSDTTLSVTKNAHIVAIPPTNSLAHFWQGQGTTTIFTIVCPAGSIVDVVLDQVLNDQEVSPLSIAVATAVLGRVYYLALDGPTTHLLVPVSLATTF